MAADPDLRQLRRIFGLECEFGLFVTGVDGKFPVERLAARFFRGNTRRWTRASGRFYLDVGAHPEHATPECTDPVSVAVHDLAGVRLAESLRAAAEDGLRDQCPDVRVHLVRNNFDGSGVQTFGCHENYLVRRQLDVDRLYDGLRGHLVARQVLYGAGELSPRGKFRVAARSEVISDERHAGTVQQKPLLNTRDEPHAAVQEWRRLHLTSGDSLMSHHQLVMRAATTHLVLRVLDETDSGLPSWGLENSTDLLVALRDVSDDLTGTATVTAGTSKWRAVDIEYDFAERAGRVLDAHGPYDDVVPAGFTEGIPGLGSAKSWEHWALEQWVADLDDLVAGGPDAVADRFDWAAKLQVARALAGRGGEAVTEDRVRGALTSYHVTDPSRSLHEKLMAGGRVRRYFSDGQIGDAMDTPPVTRALARRKVLDVLGNDREKSCTWDAVTIGATSGRLGDPFDPVVPDGFVERLTGVPEAGMVDVHGLPLTSGGLSGYFSGLEFADQCDGDD